MNIVTLDDYKVFIYIFLLVYIYVNVVLFDWVCRKPVIQKTEICYIPNYTFKDLLTELEQITPGHLNIFCFLYVLWFFTFCRYVYSV